MSRAAKSLTLTEEERQQLRRIDERGSDWRERRRARTLLLLDQGLSIDAAVTEQKIPAALASAQISAAASNSASVGAP